MTNIIEAIINFLKSIFGGNNKTVQTEEQSADQSTSEEQTETQTTASEPLNRQRMLTDPVTPIPTNDSTYVAGTRMKQSVFDFMVCNETEAVKEQVKAEMQEKDAIGEYPYTISTANATYSIHRSTNSYGWDLTETQGTSYDMATKGK